MVGERNRYRYKSPFSTYNIPKSANKDQIVVQRISEHIDRVLEEVPCPTARNRKQLTSCRCLELIRNDDQLVEQLNKLLKDFGSYDNNSRRLFLHGAVTHSSVIFDSLFRGERRRSCTFLLNGVGDGGENGRVFVCSNAFRKLFCVGQIVWKTLLEESSIPVKKNYPHLNNNVHGMVSCTQRIIDYLYNLAKEEGEPYATRYVRMLTGVGIREEEKGHVQLPSSYTKRQLYRRFCYESGWIAKPDSVGNYVPVVEYDRRPFDSEAGEFSLWPDGSQSLQVCSWRTFLNIWDKYLPFITIRSPSQDTCMDCHIFRNQQKYRQCTIVSSSSSLDNASSSLGNFEEIEGLMENPEEETEESHENLILRAAAHVREAIAQKKLASLQIEESKQSESIVTLVLDYCQNLDLPHVGEEQPGETYYFSPIWLYCLGIVDASSNKLFAYVYPESVSGRGSNNVCSCLYHYLINYVTNNHNSFAHRRPLKKLNLIMDNCGGQNKNNNVIRMCGWLMEAGFFEEVRITFLIKGHTKNQCDRLFNLLKMRWRKRNVYTFADTLQILGDEDECVKVIDASDVHYRWDEQLDKYCKKLVTGSIRKNHIFKFHTNSKQKVQLKCKTSMIDRTSVYQNLRNDKKGSMSFQNQGIRDLTIRLLPRSLVQLINLA